ncbi:MAG: hypothetical protein M3Q29_16625 [Chloroflexota bacterium]|nr:hypothetical protein [Chloroflexota bacterium]
MTTIGKIIKSNSHIDYVCQVYGPGETAHAPVPEDHALGTWVQMPAGSEQGDAAVGLVYDTQLYNPDYGTFGPRLSSQSQLEVFSPDYLNETAVLLGILVVGQMRGGRRMTSGYCPVVAPIGAPVTRLAPEGVRAFHNGAGQLELGYYSLLMSITDPIMPSLLLSVLDGLEDLMPEQTRTIGALRTNLSWKTRVELAR